MENAEQSRKPKVFTNNIVIDSISTIHYPVLASQEDTGEIAIVAVVTTTSTKIDFWINTLHALKIDHSDLLPNGWIRRFENVSTTRTGFNVRGNSKGWTEAIIKAALERYESLYDTLPLCMVGVFDHKNYELFWKAFDKLYPGKQMADFDEQTRANIAAQCIRSTHFWRPREAHGYTLLRFEVDALAKKQVLVRAYRNGLSEEVIRGVETSVKTHDHLKEFTNWKLGQ